MKLLRAGRPQIAAVIFSSMLICSAIEDGLAFGSDDYWMSGWGQGIHEAIITKGPGNRIYVTCGEGAGPGHTGIDFMLSNQPPTGSSILLTFDNNDPESYSIWSGRIPSDCRACASVYEAVLEKLRRHRSVHVRFENGDATRFTLTGSSKAISECMPDFWR